MSVIFVAVDTVIDVDQLRAYQGVVGPLVKACAHEVLFYDEGTLPLEGTPAGERVLAIRFPSEEAFRAFYDSPEYQAVIGTRLGATRGFAVLANG